MHQQLHTKTCLKIAIINCLFNFEITYTNILHGLPEHHDLKYWTQLSQKAYLTTFLKD